MQKLHQEIAKRLYIISNDLFDHYYGISPDPAKVEKSLLDQEAIWTPYGWSVGKEINLDHLELKRLPTIPVAVDFSCNCNKLEDLEGGPFIALNYFCENNRLTSLKGSPKTVEGFFSCSFNRIESLILGPEVVGGDYDARANCLKRIGMNTRVGGEIFTDYQVRVEPVHDHTSHLNWGSPVDFIVSY